MSREQLKLAGRQIDFPVTYNSEHQDIRDAQSEIVIEIMPYFTVDRDNESCDALGEYLKDKINALSEPVSESEQEGLLSSQPKSEQGEQAGVLSQWRML